MSALKAYDEVIDFLQHIGRYRLGWLLLAGRLACAALAVSSISSVKGSP